MCEEVYLRAAITKHSPPRTINLTHPKTIAAVEAWLVYRRARGWGLSSAPEYRGFRPDERLVLTHKGRAFELARKVCQLNTAPAEYRCCDALQPLMSRLYRQAGIKGGSSHSGRRTLAAKVLAKTGQVELMQLLLSHAEADHVWPYLDVDKQTIRHAFELALWCEGCFTVKEPKAQNGRTDPAYTRRVQKTPVR